MSNDRDRVALVIYDWLGTIFPSNDVADFFQTLFDAANINPNRVYFSDETGRNARFVIGVSTERSKLYKKVPNFDTIDFDDTRQTDFDNTNSSFSIVDQPWTKRIVLMKRRKSYNTIPLLNFIKKISKLRDFLENDYHKNSLLADLYTMNILNDQHLLKRVNGTSFADWIKNKEADTLHDFKEGVYVWCIPETIIPDLRDMLSQSEILV